MPDTNEFVKELKVLLNVMRPLNALQLVLPADKKELKLE